MDSCSSLLSLPVVTQKQIMKYTTVPNTKCTSLPSANRIIARCFLLGYVITFNCLNHNYQVKHWFISMPKMFSWSRIAKISLGKPFFFYSKEHKVLHQWFFKLIQNILKACNDIHEINLSHMYWMLPALALLQHSLKTLTANHDVLPDNLKLSSFHLFGKTFGSPPLKSI